MRAVLGFLFHPITVRVVGVLLLFFVLLLARILLGQYLTWLTMGLIWALTTTVAVLVAALYLWQGYRAQQRSHRIEEQIRRQSHDQLAGSLPDSRDDIAELQKRFDEALGSLRQSRLGKGALYALPWYVIIGPPGCGKTTLLTRSGLGFSSQMNQGARGVRGIGGTRNCDWWFTDRAILLDTAGRYTTETEDAEEWFAFLDMLRRARKECPLNGLMVAISIEDVLGATPEQLERHAERIRARIDEVTERLGMVLPIYLMFTKCDLLEGFVEAFEGLSKEERQQVWGRTIEEHERERPMDELFLEGFDDLAARLRERRLGMLAVERPMARQRKVFGFAMQFAHGRERLGDFVRLVTRPDPYREAAELRGFYFTSGTQEGTPVDRALSDMRRAFRVKEDASDHEPRRDTKAYFIQDLLTEVIIPDQDLARRSSSIVQRQRVLRLAGLILVGLATAVFGISTIAAGFGENSRIGSAWEVVRNFDDVRIDQGELDPATNEVHRRWMDELREVFVAADEDYWGSTIRLFGPSDDLYLGLWSTYRDVLSSVYLRPMLGRIEERMREQVTALDGLVGKEYADRFEAAEDLLVAYRMIARPDARLDREMLGSILERRHLWSWTPAEILVGGGSRNQFTDPQALHLEAFLGHLLRPSRNYRDMRVTYDAALAARLDEVIRDFDLLGKEVAQVYEDDPASIHDPEDARRKLWLNRAEEHVKRTEPTLSPDEFDRRVEEVAEQMIARDRVERERRLLQELETLELPEGLGQSLDTCRRILANDELVAALRPQYERITDTLLSQEFITLGELGSADLARQVFVSVMASIGTLEETLRTITASGALGSRILPLIGDSKRQSSGDIEALVKRFNTVQQQISQELEDKLAQSTQFREASRALYERIMQEMLQALATEARTEAASAWTQGPSKLLGGITTRFPFSNNENVQSVDLESFRRVFGSDGGIREFEQQMERLHDTIKFGPMPLLEFDEGMRETFERAERIRSTLLTEDGTRTIDFLLPLFETSTGVVEMTLYVTGKTKVSTEDLDVPSQKLGWRLGETGAILELDLIDERKHKRFNEDHKSDPWSLFRLLATDTRRAMRGGDLYVEWSWEYQPDVASPVTERTIGFTLRALGTHNPFRPDFFDFAPVAQVFRDAR